MNKYVSDSCCCRSISRFDDLCLDGHVEGGYRLVQNEERRVERKSTGKPDALALTAAELVRKAIEMGGVETDKPEELPDALLACSPIAKPVNDERLLDDLLRAHSRIQRRIRVLKHDLHVTACFAQLRPREAKHVLSAKAHAA